MRQSKVSQFIDAVVISFLTLVIVGISNILISVFVNS